MLWPSLKRKNANEDGTIPTSPRALRRWIKDLPLVDMGETARRFYNGLLELNRSELPPQQRIEDMELMREAAQTVLRHLNKQFVARSLPLPPKGRKILRLMLTLHKELSAGYKLAMRDSAKAGTIDPSLTALATQRAMYYMGEIFLRSVQMYEPEPAGLWHDIHLLYAFAEERGVSESPIGSGKRGAAPDSSVAQTYIRILLSALCLPRTLRQGEIERLNAFFAKHSSLVTISRQPTPDARNGVYLANLELDRPPAYMVLSETPAMHSVRAFNLGNLLGYLRERIQTDSAGDKEGLTPDLIRRIYKNLTSNSKRRFARNDRDETIYVAIGLNQINRAIDADQDLPPRGLRLTAPGMEISSGIFNLQTIDNELRGGDKRDDYYDPNATSEDIWGLVVNDSIWEQDRTERLVQNRQPVVPLDDFATPSAWSTWQLCNASPGGFGIRWDSDQPARAQVGEIIALREREGSHSAWRIGVIRWMHFVSERGLEVGVQLLAAQCVRASLRADSTDSNQENLIDALLLPELDSRDRPGSLVVPHGQFRIGQAVVATVGETTTRLRLQERMEYSHSFTQYECQCSLSTNDDQPPPPTPGNDGFDSLWEKL
jgi:cyclic-di-GMP-binding protein